MSTPYRVLVVCTGNICRSPMAEIVLRDRFEAAGMSHVVVDSAAVSAWEVGSPIDHRAAAVLAAQKYVVPPRVARQALAQDLVDHDLVLAMTADHAQALRRLAPDEHAARRVVMYRSFDPDAPSGPERQLDVADPWYGDEADFVTCLELVEAAADGVVEHVRAELFSRSRR